MIARRLLSAGCVAAVLAVGLPCGAWTLSKNAIRPMLVQAQKEVQECAREHLLPDGRYAVWIVVNARGRGRVELRDAPAAVSASGRRCVMRAYSKQIYPKAIEASVAWSAASPPRATYSIAFPFELRRHGYGFGTGLLDVQPVRPRPAKGGRSTPCSSGYTPQFYFGATDVPGTLEAGDRKLEPGDRSEVDFALGRPIALEPGMRFAMREGKRTVGRGNREVGGLM